MSKVHEPAPGTDGTTARWRSPHPSPGTAVSDVGVILDVAAKMLAERGFVKFSMQDLADEVGIAKPTLYAYVGTKASLVEGIFDRVLGYGEDLIADAHAQENPRDRLRAIVAAWTGVSINRPDYYRVYLGAGPELPVAPREAVRRRGKLIMNAIRDIVRECQDAGLLDPDADPTVLAFTISWICLGTGQWYRPGGPVDEDALVALYMQMIESGVAAPSGAPRGDRGATA